MKTIRIKIIGGRLKTCPAQPKFINTVQPGAFAEGWKRSEARAAGLADANRVRMLLAKSIQIFLAVGMLVLPLVWQTTASAQGMLTPPGAPVPGMKSLSQVEARTAITNTTTPLTISQPGSYYLTANLTLTTGDAITIAAGNVTLDLNGFTISTTAVGGSGTAIAINTVQTNISIRNGFITSGITNNGAITYGGAGFARGISALAALYNARVTDVNIHGCLLTGITLSQGTGTVVKRCTVNNVGWTGIVADMVIDSMSDVGGYGSNPAIQAGTVINSRGNSYGGNGITAAQIADNSTGASTTSGGLISVVAVNCNGSSSSAQPGLNSILIDNCFGVSGTGNGIYTLLANNSVGTTASPSSQGFYTVYLATCCYGSSGSAASGIYSLGSLNSCAGTFTAASHKYNMP